MLLLSLFKWTQSKPVAHTRSRRWSTGAPLRCNSSHCMHFKVCACRSCWKLEKKHCTACVLPSACKHARFVMRPVCMRAVDHCSLIKRLTTMQQLARPQVPRSASSRPIRGDGCAKSLVQCRLNLSRRVCAPLAAVQGCGSDAPDSAAQQDERRASQLSATSSRRSALLLGAGALLAAQAGGATSPHAAQADDFSVTPSGLRYLDLRCGCLLPASPHAFRWACVQPFCSM